MGQSDIDQARNRFWDPATTAVVLSECQVGVLGPDTVLPALYEAAKRVLPTIERLAHIARDAGATVVHATFDGLKGAEHPGSAPLWRALLPATREWGDNSPGAQVLPQLLGDGDLVLPRHQGLNPAASSDLLPVLRGRGIRTVVLAGASLNVAIPLAAGEAVQQGFDVVVISDASVAAPAEYAQHALKHSLSMIARIVTTDELEAGLGAGAGR